LLRLGNILGVVVAKLFLGIVEAFFKGLFFDEIFGLSIRITKWVLHEIIKIQCQFKNSIVLDVFRCIRSSFHQLNGDQQS
jgi:hypothetical protein